MKIMVTAEEYYETSKFGKRSIPELMIEFAKIHVKAALESAATKAELKEYDEYQFGGGYVTKMEIDENSILDSYPENLIM